MIITVIQQDTYDSNLKMTANHPGLSIAEDYRRGNYYIKHTHNVVGETLYIVYRDNSPRNFKMNVDINKCIKYIEAHTPGATKASVRV